MVKAIKYILFHFSSQEGAGSILGEKRGDLQFIMPINAALNRLL